ncbi:MAG: RpiB/LacA/LacB family sugar-phosphate isomerase [Tepidisphaeraceae bacterium]|jgi:ribose 5-phosphate isomerase B
MVIAIGCVRRGFRAKLQVAEFLRQRSHEVEDFGCDGAAATVASSDLMRGLVSSLNRIRGNLAILVGRDGAGLCIAANKLRGLRAVVADDEWTAANARERYGCNVLCIGAERHGPQELNQIVAGFLAASAYDRRDTQLEHELMEIEAATEANTVHCPARFAQL